MCDFSRDSPAASGRGEAIVLHEKDVDGRDIQREDALRAFARP
jgi:hypothetical protein